LRAIIVHRHYQPSPQSASLAEPSRIFMNDNLSRIFRDFDKGRITRRELLAALGMAGAAPSALSAMGRGRAIIDPVEERRAEEARREIVLPFEPTGWKCVWLDRLTYSTTDYKKATAFYSTLMGWKIRSDNGREAVLDIADRVGNAVIRGGYTPPPTPPPAPAAPAPVAGAAGGAAAGGAGGAGGAGAGGAGAGAAGGRAGGGGGRGGTRPPVQGIWDNVCWGITPWDTNKVEAELKARGLDPIADHSGDDFRSFHVKDTDGFDLQISNGTKALRWKTNPTVALPAPAPFAAAPWKTVWIDHFSHDSRDGAAAAAFYMALLGWVNRKPATNGGTCDIGDVGCAIVRGGQPGAAATPLAPGAPPRPLFGHISFGISPWDWQKVSAELTARGLAPSVDTGGEGPMEVAKYQSYHVRDSQNWDLQIANVTFETRTLT
jgi:predicted enzyme related to lactoylglutathione lyase